MGLSRSGFREENGLQSPSHFFCAGVKSSPIDFFSGVVSADRIILWSDMPLKVEMDRGMTQDAPFSSLFIFNAF